jgi:hypothetical protein
MKFPDHKCSLTLTHNAHRDYYESVEQWEAKLKECGSMDGAGPVEIGWVSVEQRDKAIATDNVWEIQWYPDTPIGFFRLLACDLDVLLDEAGKG